MSATITNPGSTTEQLGRNSLFNSAIVGLFVGIVGWLLTFAFYEYVVKNVFCRSADTSWICANGQDISWMSAYVIIGMASVYMLVRANVYRPLFVVLAVFVSLWGINVWLSPLSWYISLLWSAVLFSLAYALFAWLASIERFIMSALAIVIMVVAIRLVMLYF